jgi:hypothetical protein
LPLQQASMQERAPVQLRGASHQLTARVLAQRQEGLRGLGTQQQEAWLSEGLSEGR